MDPGYSKLIDFAANPGACSMTSAARSRAMPTTTG